MAAVTSRRDEYAKVIEFRGPDTVLGSRRAILRATKSLLDGRLITTQVYVADKYTSRGWRFYSDAYDANGTRLPTTVIIRDVLGCSSIGCSRDEHVGVEVTREQLKAAGLADGLHFRLYGRGGNIDIDLTAAYVRGFLAALE